MSLFGELSRRNVFRVGIAYAIVAWLVLQVADIVLETIGAPPWVMQTLMLGLTLGFFVALIFSWAYEVTPEGIKRESEVDRSTSITSMTGRKLDRVIIGLLVAALAYFFWESRIADRPADELVANTVDAEADVQEVIATPAQDVSIAVLPFENRSALADDAFFAEGMHDDLLTTLANIGSMKVISRTSVMRYADDDGKSIPEIAAELGVANILEGGVQRAGNQVRINVQLIDADTDEHLWAKTYDRELTAENLFAIQSEISKAIADELHATLSPQEVERLDKAPTKSLEAFDHYLRARNLMATRTVDNLELSTREFLKAVEIDPEFALAWVGVADSHDLLASYADLPSATFAEIGGDAIDKALALDPELGEAYASLGSRLFDQGDFEAAEEAHRKAIELSPNYATAWHWLGIVTRQNTLRAYEAQSYISRAAELDPNSAVILTALIGGFGQLGNYEAAGRYIDRLVELHPDFGYAHSTNSWRKLREGEIVAAIESQQRAIEIDPGNAMYRAYMVFNYVMLGATEEAGQELQRMIEHFPDHPMSSVVRLSLTPGEPHPNARAGLAALLDGELNVDMAWETAFAAMYLNEPDFALDALDRTLISIPENGEYSEEFMGRTLGSHCHIAWTLLETEGNEARGQALLERAMALHEAGYAEGIQRPERFSMELCYVLVGDIDTALDLIEAQLPEGSVMNWRWDLAMQPFDAIRGHPRFAAAWNEYERRMAEQLAILRAAEEKPAFEF